MEYILVALMTQTSLGTFQSQAACQSAIKSIYVAKLDPEVAKTPAVVHAINTQLKYQKDYVCLPRSTD